MKKLTLKLVVLTNVFLWSISLGGAIPAAPSGGYPVMDVTSIGKIVDHTTQQATNFQTQISKMDDQY